MFRIERFPTNASPEDKAKRQTACSQLSLRAGDLQGIEVGSGAGVLWCHDDMSH